ncbi:MAG: ABC transporter ATP-binding protein [Bacilli bacterium]|jgi:ABC-2 type transport system ATP-binding protein|nr:ABC transporter ATP-binding protein [Bacilli bacterium]
MLELKNYTKSYVKGKTIVDNLSLKVEKGDIYAFVGHNGAGKTTTIKSIVGILEFDKGDILIDNKSIKKNEIECKMKMAYIPDNPDLYEHLKGISYLNFIADIYKVSKEKREELIKKYAEKFELTKNLGDPISSYSHGMKQKLAIISALIHEPKLLILDEPFVGLDPKASHTLKEIMKEMVKEGTAIFFSTHVLEVAEKLCNKIAIIKEGKIIVEGKMKDIIKDKSLEDIFMELVDEKSN